MFYDIRYGVNTAPDCFYLYQVNLFGYRSIPRTVTRTISLSIR